MGNSRKCAFCSAEVAKGDAFCQACGKPMAMVKCGSCGTANNAGDSFCQKCGQQIKRRQEDNQTEQNAAPTTTVVYVEPPVAFASGLPKWNIEPPAVVVRRRRVQI